MKGNSGLSESDIKDNAIEFNVGEMLFPVNEEYAVIWYKIEANPETARRIKENHDRWTMVTGNEITNMVFRGSEDLLSQFKEETRSPLKKPGLSYLAVRPNYYQSIFAFSYILGDSTPEGFFY
jgi:hypothetical protein